MNRFLFLQAYFYERTQSFLVTDRIKFATGTSFYSDEDFTETEEVKY